MTYSKKKIIRQPTFCKYIVSIWWSIIYKIVVVSINNNKFHQNINPTDIIINDRNKRKEKNRFKSSEKRLVKISTVLLLLYNYWFNKSLQHILSITKVLFRSNSRREKTTNNIHNTDSLFGPIFSPISLQQQQLFTLTWNNRSGQVEKKHGLDGYSL